MHFARNYADFTGVVLMQYVVIYTSNKYELLYIRILERKISSRMLWSVYFCDHKMQYYYYYYCILWCVYRYTVCPVQPAWVYISLVYIRYTFSKYIHTKNRSHIISNTYDCTPRFLTDKNYTRSRIITITTLCVYMCLIYRLHYTLL